MANFNFNKVIIGGRVSSDIELKTTQSGVSVTTFSVAVNRPPVKDHEQQTDFLNVTAWRGTADFASKYFHRGSSICVDGSIQTRSWDDQNGQKRYATEIVANNLYFVDAKNDNSAVNSIQKAPAAPTAQQTQENNQNYVPAAYGTPGTNNKDKFVAVNDDDELPF